jgi:hypothetical protein
MFTGEMANPVDIEKAGERWSLFSFESNVESKPPSPSRCE